MANYYRVTRMSSGVYASSFDDFDEEVESIKHLVDNGEATLIVDDLASAAEIFDCEVKDIKIVDEEDDDTD